MTKLREWLNAKGQFIAPLAIVVILLVAAYFSLQISQTNAAQASGDVKLAAMHGGGCGAHEAAGGGCGGGCGGGDEKQTVANGTPLFPEKPAKTVKTVKVVKK